MKHKTLSSSRKAYVGCMKALMYLCAGLTGALVLFLVSYVLVKGLPNITWGLLSTSPSYLTERIGILPDLMNTIYIVLATIVIVLPLGVGAAIYLTEYAKNKKLVAVIEYAAETLSGIFRKNLETFWGDAVELTEGCELTWMRQPHYYMGLYSYTYSAGLTLATQAALNIAAEGESAVARWRAMLEAGSTRDPLGLAAIAGIDLSTPDALEHTIAYISDIIDEIAALTEEIDGITLD